MGVGYFRDEPGPDPVRYEICLVEGGYDVATLWFLDAPIGPLVSRLPDAAGGGQARLHADLSLGPEPLPGEGIRDVRFLLDGQPVRTERFTPYDLAGGSVSAARPFDMSRITPGSHVLTAIARTTDGSEVVTTASFRSLP